MYNQLAKVECSDLRIKRRLSRIEMKNLYDFIVYVTSFREWKKRKRWECMEKKEKKKRNKLWDV